VSILIEVVACTADEAVQAEAAGADRIELVSAISEGGLTPSIGALRETKARCRLPVVAMLRPRGGGFVYSDAEFSTLLRDAEVLLASGADGLVAGVFDSQGLDERRMRELVSLAQGCPVVFHRAFDLLPNPLEAVDRLIDLGISRILTSGRTSGGADPARLAAYRAHARGRIQILAGGGIRAGNVLGMIETSGVDQIHFGPFKPRPDPFSASAANRSLAEHLSLDLDEVRRLVANVRGADAPPRTLSQ
jgi:copper homeostasis protein